MKIQLITVGRLDEEYDTLVNKYFKMLTIKLQNDVLLNEKNKSIDEIRIKEGKKILSKVKPGYLIIALDEQGKHFNSQEFSAFLVKYKNNHQNICFVIGGAYGLSNEIREKADMILSLSNMTLPHKFAKLMLIEQIYRAETIQTNHPYHK